LDSATISCDWVAIWRAECLLNLNKNFGSAGFPACLARYPLCFDYNREVCSFPEILGSPHHDIFSLFAWSAVMFKHVLESHLAEER
jgi:hypothetical protein